MRILITGIGGFVGGHLTELLIAEGGHDIHGLTRSAKWPEALQHLNQCATLHAADLCDTQSVNSVVRAVRPEWVFHLAGYASPGKSFREPAVCWEHNLIATRNLFDALVSESSSAKVVFVSSGLVYGDPTGPDDSFDESRLLLPASPYASSKAAADLMAYQYTRNTGLHIVRIRPFNHIGPRQSAEYAIANFARQVAAVVKNHVESPIIETGNLSARRDLTDVRDVVQAYRLAVENGRSGEVYNVGQGAAYGMDEILYWLVNIAGVAVEVRQNTNMHGKADTAVSRCDASKIRKELGWQPQFALGQTLREVLNYWKQMPLKK